MPAEAPVPIPAMPRGFPIRVPRKGWVALATGVVIILACLAWMFRIPGRQFDQDLWSEFGDFNQSSRYPRLEMADRLVAAEALRGRTRNEVVEMLGEPPHTEYFREWNLVYWLGPERGFMSIDSEWLVFRFDTQGHVAEYRIVRD